MIYYCRKTQPLDKLIYAHYILDTKYVVAVAVPVVLVLVVVAVVVIVVIAVVYCLL